MLDKEKVYDFLIKGSELITALAVFSALFVALVKYANNDLYKKLDKIEIETNNRFDTIENNHIYHLGLDMKENKKEHESFVQEIKELKRENTEEHKEMRQELKQQGNDISYIRGLLEKQFGVKK